MRGLLSCCICHDCDSSLRFFHVPTASERLRQWCDLLDMEIETSSIVCEKHFLEEHFTKNFKLNCWRLNSKAQPTLYLSDKCISDNFGDKDDFDNNKVFQQNAGAEKEDCHDFSTFELNCLWCDNSFCKPDLYRILLHLFNKHPYQLESFVLDAKREIKDENVEPYAASEELEENERNTQDTEVYGDLEESCYIDEMDMETDTMYEIGSAKSEHFDEAFDEDYDGEIVHKVGECNVENSNDHNLNPFVEKGQRKDNFDGIFQIPRTTVTINKMLPVGETSNNVINMEKRNPQLIFFIIDLLISMPTLWFINCFKSKEYEDSFNDFCEKFSEEYAYFMNQNELHDSLIELRDWYMKVYEGKASDKLTYPQNEYFHILEEFLPDKLDGKTCELCGECYSDHIQYFAHKKLKHEISDDCNDDDVDDKTQSILNNLKSKSRAYYYARYPLWQKFSYHCKICPENLRNRHYWTKLYFYEHIKKHLDIRDHVCDVCGKTFVQQSLFEIHQKRHLGKHKFVCKICGKNTFTNGSLLTAHRKRYHLPVEGTIEEIEALVNARIGVWPKTLFVRSEVFELQSTNDGSKVYACRYCDKTYIHRSGVFNHFRRTHPDIKVNKRRSGKRQKV